MPFPASSVAFKKSSIDVISFEEIFQTLRLSEHFSIQFLVKTTPSVVLYLRANNSSERFIKLMIMTIAGGFTIAVLFLAAIGAAFYYIRDGHIETVNLYLPLVLRYCI